MDDCNFLFLKEKNPEIYKRCCFDVDLAIADKNYANAISNSRIVLEMILKPKDDQDLKNKIYSLKTKIPDEIIDCMNDVREWGNAVMHVNVRKRMNIKEFTKEHADDIASKLHRIAWSQFPNIRFDDEEYHVIKGDEKWISELKGDNNAKNNYLLSIAEDIIKKADEQINELDNSINADKIINFEDIRKREADFIETKEVMLDIISDLSNDEENSEIVVNLENKCGELTQKFEEFQSIKEEKITYDFEVNEILDKKQRIASYYKGDKLIIKAGPGAGKTTVLIERIKYFINERKYDAKSLLVITFTEKAARELKEKLLKEDISQIAVDNMQISTIHSFCRTLLKDYSFSATELIDDNNSERKVLFLKKYKDKLGFKGYNFIPDSELRDVSRKFDQYSSFEVDTEKLAEYVEKTMLNKGKRSEGRFKDFVDSKFEETGEFPVFEVQERESFNQRWIIHKFHAILKAYNIYKEHLGKEGLFDFNYLQLKARDFLKENRIDVGYENILIDEFQDTDKVQMEMFEYLMEGCNTITMVGDPDQCIYSWRGSEVDYFDKIMKREDFVEVILETNYRSCKNLVEFNESYMSNYRPFQEVIPNNKNDGDLYYILNKNKESEAKIIAKTIKHLKTENKILNYSDVALISRSRKRKHIQEIVTELENIGIPSIIKGFEDFAEYTEVNAIMNLLWYLTSPMDKYEEFNIQLFCDDDINNEMFNFKDSTLKVLSTVENPQEFSAFTREQLEDVGVVDDRDLEIFTRLNNLKKELHESEDLTILDAYYKLLNITDYVESKYGILSAENDESYKNPQIMNIALISYKIRCFMDIESRSDIDGFFSFIYSNYQTYSSPMNELTDEDKVNILTAHRAKGLEFPVVFVCSLQDRSFPYEFIRDEDYKTPLNYLYKKYSDIESEFQLNDIELALLGSEERRVIYVALTRAESCLIVSGVENNGLQSKELSIMRERYPQIEELTEANINNLKEIESGDEFKQDDLTLSFTSIEDYDKCPHLYNLAHNYRFETPQNEGMYMGTIAHGALNGINTKAVMNEVSEDDVNYIIDKSFESNPSLEDNDRFELIMNSVGDYWDEFGVNCKILASEYPFTLIRNENGVKYNVKGQIDLILQENPENNSGITLLDYKTNVNISNPETYIKQLHLYLLGIEHDPYFTKKDVENLVIYSLASKNPKKDIKPSIITKHKLEQQLSNTAKLIRNNHYQKTKDTNECRQCLLKDLCNIED